MCAIAKTHAGNGAVPRHPWCSSTGCSAPGDDEAVPPQHVNVYDEAQRAWDVEQVTAKHALPFPKSEPEAFVDCGERIPGCYVLVGLIGSSREIHVGEEAGLGQWRTALEKAGDPGGWKVHAAEAVLSEFFDGDDPTRGRELAARLEKDGYHLRMTRDLDVANDQPT
jgi:hypothetical protein